MTMNCKELVFVSAKHELQYQPSPSDVNLPWDEAEVPCIIARRALGSRFFQFLSFAESRKGRPGNDLNVGIAGEFGYVSTGEPFHSQGEKVHPPNL